MANLKATGSNTYKYIPLGEPGNQIRLLSFVPSSRDENQPTTSDIRCTLTTWNLETAPAFRAISYTWGDPTKLQNVLVDGKSMEVRSNCFNALWQVRLHWPDGYFWIDSICINQSDNTEKGPQVAMMGELYAAAFRVCACLGPHDNTSPALFDFVGEFDGFVAKVASGDVTLTTEESNDHYMTWLRSLDSPEQLHTLADALFHFGERPYWKRLWILQELQAATRKRIDILCGPDILDLGEDFRLFQLHTRIGYCVQYNALQLPAPTPLPLHRIESILDNRTRNFPEDLYIILSGGFQCFDIRDRVFGTLRLFDWPESVVPDYGLSRWELALRLVLKLPERNFGDLRTILRLMEISLEDIKERSSALKTVPQSTTTALETVEQSWIDDYREPPVSVFRNEAGELCCDFRGESTPRGQTIYPDTPVGWTTIRRSPASFVQTDCLVEPGDVLLQTKYMELVLRPQKGTCDSDSFEVIGQILPTHEPSPSEYNPGPPSDPCRCPNRKPLRKSLEVTMSTLDAMEIVAGGIANPGDTRPLVPPANVPKQGSMARDVSDPRTHLPTCFTLVDRRKEVRIEWLRKYRSGQMQRPLVNEGWGPDVPVYRGFWEGGVVQTAGAEVGSLDWRADPATGSL